MGLAFPALFVYSSALQDYSENLRIASGRSGLSTVVPILISQGPWAYSIFLAALSVLAVASISLLLVIVREELINKILKIGR